MFGWVVVVWDGLMEAWMSLLDEVLMEGRWSEAGEELFLYLSLSPRCEGSREGAGVGAHG